MSIPLSVPGNELLCSEMNTVQSDLHPSALTNFLARPSLMADILFLMSLTPPLHSSSQSILSVTHEIPRSGGNRHSAARYLARDGQGACRFL